GLQPDELFVRDADTLLDVNVDTQTAVILVSAWLGKARLIDNMRVPFNAES
ncbi:MAG: pantoate--beta-alanine ligase, partial [Hafnia alvei]